METTANTQTGGSRVKKAGAVTRLIARSTAQSGASGAVESVYLDS